ncbi:MAG TPA: class I SAM-dependent methyltransferase [Actinomycetes bacterium]|nr:class I SAM-dependent methyltransferase [Actinomycetes bacterium]
MKFDARREALLRWVASLLPFAADAPIRVLDVGGGHGPFASEILTAYTASTVCLQDFSEVMLRKAADRLAGFPDRFDFHLADLRDPGWATDLCGPFHAAVSALVLHSLDRATVRRLCADIVGVLRPGGCFLNLDLVLQPPQSGVIARIHQAAGPAGFSHPHDGDDADDPPPTLEEHLRWLREGGFGEVDCVWKHGRQSLLCGVRSAPVPA